MQSEDPARPAVKRAGNRPASAGSTAPVATGDSSCDRLRILHVAESFAAGTYEVVRLLALRLVGDGHEVAVAYREIPETPRKLAKEFPVEVKLERLRWRRRTPISTAIAAQQMRHFATRYRPTVIHLHSSFAGLAGSFALPSVAPTIYTPHGISIMRRRPGSVMRRIEALGERWISSRVDLVGAVSGEEERLLRDEVGARNVTVIPNGVPELDNAVTRELVPSSARPLVVSMGRITRQRRPESTARVLASVAEIADILWIGGTDSKAGVELPQIPKTGWLDRRDAVAALARAKVLVHWSAWDSHPLAVLEAMAQDVLVIASDIAVNRELLGGEQVCASEEDASRLLRRALTDPTTFQRLISAQRDRRSRFSARRMGDEWIRAYRSLASSSGQEKGTVG